jgi:hypothetical protein
LDLFGKFRKFLSPIRCFAPAADHPDRRFNDKRWRIDMSARTLALLLAFSGIAMCLGTGPGLADTVLADRRLAQDNQGIKPFVPNGTYADYVTGYVAGPSGSLVPLAAAGHLTFSADGTTSGVFTGSINGQISTFPVHGTWTINPDGSISETDVQAGGPGLTLHFKKYPTLDGNTITGVQSDPGSIVSVVETRGSPAANEQ